MKKIGFIDLFIDEWHANNYPGWFKDAPNWAGFELGYAWEEAAKPGAKPLPEWCAQFGMKPARSIAEVVEKSDAVCVLAPSNPEVHERLAEVALRSGKPLFIDKPFAPDRATAERIFQAAAASGTPLMSSSALRFSNELRQDAKTLFADGAPRFAGTTGGGGNFPEYAIHQLEMIVSQLGTGAVGVTQCVNGTTLHGIVHYADDRLANFTYNPNLGFTVALANAGHAAIYNATTQMFPNLLAAVLDFFATGKSPIATAETIEIAALLDASVRALKTPGQMVRL